MTIRYCTPDWLEESSKLYRATDHFREALQKITTKIFYRITSNPAWGIDWDFLFGAVVEKGNLLELGFYTERESKERADFILSTSPQVWKGILRKEKKFITEFMLGKVSLEQGSKPGLLLITPYANHFVDALTQVELQFPDEMTPEALKTYRADLAEFREKAGLSSE